MHFANFESFPHVAWWTFPMIHKYFAKIADLPSFARCLAKGVA